MLSYVVVFLKQCKTVLLCRKLEEIGYSEIYIQKKHVIHSVILYD